MAADEEKKKDYSQKTDYNPPPTPTSKSKDEDSKSDYEILKIADQAWENSWQIQKNVFNMIKGAFSDDSEEKDSSKQKKPDPDSVLDGLQQQADEELASIPEGEAPRGGNGPAAGVGAPPDPPGGAPSVQWENPNPGSNTTQAPTQQSMANASDNQSFGQSAGNVNSGGGDVGNAVELAEKHPEEVAKFAAML